MGKSRTKHPIMKITGPRTSDKEDRHKANRKLRRAVKILIRKGIYFFPVIKELSDIWGFASDGGRHYWRNLNERWRRK